MEGDERRSLHAHPLPTQVGEFLAAAIQSGASVVMMHQVLLQPWKADALEVVGGSFLGRAWPDLQVAAPGQDGV